jgi:hypothetical protein
MFTFHVWNFFRTDISCSFISLVSSSVAIIRINQPWCSWSNSTFSILIHPLSIIISADSDAFFLRNTTVKKVYRAYFILQQNNQRSLTTWNYGSNQLIGKSSSEKIWSNNSFQINFFCKNFASLSSTTNVIFISYFCVSSFIKNPLFRA